MAEESGGKAGDLHPSDALRVRSFQLEGHVKVIPAFVEVHALDVRPELLVVGGLILPELEVLESLQGAGGVDDFL